MTAIPAPRPAGAELVSHGPRAAVTPHHLATQTAISVMDRGGNAVDAAIAANAVLGVVAPETCGIGGDLFALVHSPGMARPAALNASGRAGGKASGAMARAAGLDHVSPHSKWAVTIPGCVDGWLALIAHHAALPIDEILAPAIEFATEGFPVTAELSSALAQRKEVLLRQLSSTHLYPGGIPPAAGAEIRRPDLGRTMLDIIAAGRDGFYDGRTGRDIILATDDLITPSDLATPQADWVDPISLEVMGSTGWTVPPNSQGYLTLAAAWIFEQLAPPRDPEDPIFTHAAIEAYRSVAWERDNLVSDAATAPQPASRLLDRARLSEKVARLSLAGRTPWPAPGPAPGGTAYLCVRDADGLGISLIQSNFHDFGSGIGVGDSGFFLHDRGAGFTLTPGHPNELGPGKRPLHTLAPSLWTEAGSLVMLLGTRGGDFQPQTLLQMLAHLLWAGDDAATAQRRPRWTTREWRRNHTGVAYEPHLDQQVAAALARLGHQPEPAPGWMAGWGPVALAVAEGDGYVGAADPRITSTAALA